MRTNDPLTRAIRARPSRELLAYFRGEDESEGMTYRLHVIDMYHATGADDWRGVLAEVEAADGLEFVAVVNPDDPPHRMRATAVDDPASDAWCVLMETVREDAAPIVSERLPVMHTGPF